MGHCQAAREGCHGKEKPCNTEVGRAVCPDGSLHEQLLWVVAGVQHAHDNFCLQHVDLRVELDCCQAAVEGLQAGSGKLRVLHESQRVLISSTPPPPSAGRTTKCAIRLTISCN